MGLAISKMLNNIQFALIFSVTNIALGQLAKCAAEEKKHKFED